MRKFTIECDVGGYIAPQTIWVGSPKEDQHPLYFQNKFFSDKGVQIPDNVMEAISQLRDLARKNNVRLEDLAVYALHPGDEDEKAAELLKNVKKKKNSDKTTK